MANELQNTKKSSKRYCSLMKIFLNYNKITVAPSLFHNNHYFLNVTQKKRTIQ